MLESSSKNLLLFIQHSDCSNVNQNVSRMTLRDLNSPRLVKLGYPEVTASPGGVALSASCQLERKVSRKNNQAMDFQQ